MTLSWEVGKEARELDKKSIKERMKVEGRSVKRVGYAMVFYSIMMVLFYIFL
ncbi:MAG: hypothetical protein ACFFA4_16330 [Promethearchaeota archaeon]